jgi:hypothetical protein
MRKLLAIIFVFFAYTSSLFGMNMQTTKARVKNITKEHFTPTVQQYFSHALNKWLKHTDMSVDNNLYSTIKTIQSIGIKALLNDQCVMQKVNTMFTHMQRDDRYHDDLSITSNLYKKNIMILGLQILLTYVHIRPPQDINFIPKKNGIVSDERLFLKKNYSWDTDYLPQLKAAFLLLSLELSKTEK